MLEKRSSLGIEVGYNSDDDIWESHTLNSRHDATVYLIFFMINYLLTDDLDNIDLEFDPIIWVENVILSVKENKDEQAQILIGYITKFCKNIKKYNHKYNDEKYLKKQNRLIKNIQDFLKFLL